MPQAFDAKTNKQIAAALTAIFHEVVTVFFSIIVSLRSNSLDITYMIKQIAQ